MQPYRIDGPAQICFSGGRSSAYMLYQILQANGGLPPDVFVTFQNTGKEREETLLFVRECGERWGVPIRWLEYAGRAADVPKSKCDWREVSFATAARHGEPFAQLIDREQFLPNPVARVCTINLKIRVGAAFMHAQGFSEWDAVMGIRGDEPRRVARMSDPKRDNSAGVPLLPLARAQVRKADVLAFWQAQPFDLALDALGDLGNCDLCYLKARHKLVRALVTEPQRAVWWIEQEAKGISTFRNDRPRYSELQREAAFYARQMPLDFEPDDTDEALADCMCGD